MNHNIYNRGSNGAWLPVNLYVSALTDLSGPFTLGVWVLAQNGAMFTLLVADMELHVYSTYMYTLSPQKHKTLSPCQTPF